MYRVSLEIRNKMYALKTWTDTMLYYRFTATVAQEYMKPGKPEMCTANMRDKREVLERNGKPCTSYGQRSQVELTSVAVVGYNRAGGEIIQRSQQSTFTEKMCG